MLFDAYVLWPFVKKSFEFVKRISTPDSTVVKKSVNLEYNTLVRWDKWIVHQASFPFIIFFSWFLAKFIANIVSIYSFISL